MGMPKIRPHTIETPDLVEIEFGTVDYIGKMTAGAKFHVNPSMGASRQVGEIYTKCLCLFISIFSETHLQVRPSTDFSARWL